MFHNRSILVTVLFSALAAGCGGGTDLPEFHTIEGDVTFQGKPVKEGVVTFENVDPKAPKPRNIAVHFNDGHYLTVQAPAGKYNVTITPWGSGNASAIPDKYHTAVNSKLTTEIKIGTNKYDIELQP